jgi:hypothetical protein
MISVAPKKLVFDESTKGKTQLCKVEIRNKGQKAYMVLSHVYFSRPMLIYYYLLRELANTSEGFQARSSSLANKAIAMLLFS